MPIWHLLIGWSLNKHWSLRDTNRWKVRKKFSFMIFFLHSASYRGHNEYTDSGWTRTWKNIRAKIYSRIDWTSYWSQKKISRPGFGFWICPIYAIFCLCWLHVLRRLLSWQWGTGVPECIQVSIIAIFMHTYIKSFLKQPPLKVMELRQTLANGKILNHKRFLGSCWSKGEIWLLSNRWVSVVEFHDQALVIGKVFGQESTVVKWNYQILGLHQVTVRQKLGVILVIKWF